MSVLQTVLVYVLVPLALFAVVSLLAAGRRRQRPTRYRPGEPWRHEPVWWTANPAGAPIAEHTEPLVSPAKGGAQGGW